MESSEVEHLLNCNTKTVKDDARQDLTQIGNIYLSEYAYDLEV